ncbi:hypothetical protein TNIN_115151 [Trichonephila inaurata madagascariensis]|uniref:Uncharacterized protein n=1 Tax=Trichonephila inaurata madagascariensis TaxID=2747483 RepID=A0A8X6YJP7_9ARAC|nr:hypothetical protein TNIN_115151 [Trichonephila inaurata madagascariensis]
MESVTSCKIFYRMEKKLKAVPLGFRGSSIPYKEFEDERGSTSEEVKEEPLISFSHISHCLDTHQVHLQRCTSVAVRTTSGSALQWLFGLQVSSYQKLPGHYQVYLQRCSSGAVQTKFSHISQALDIIKSTYSDALRWLFGLQV